MGGLLKYDGLLARFFSKLVDAVCLSLLWLISSIPLITVGASTTALYYTVNKVIRNDEGKLWQEYWHSFRVNFKQATVAWLVILGIYCLIGVGGYSTYILYLNYELPQWTVIMLCVVAVLVTAWMLYVFPSIARFANRTFDILANCAKIAMLNLLQTLLLLLLFVVAVLAVLYVPSGPLFVPAGYMYFGGMVIEYVFARYISADASVEV